MAADVPRTHVATGMAGHRATVAIVHQLPCPAEATWAVVGDWGNQEVGAGFVERVEISGRETGATRTLILRSELGGGQVVERLEEHDDLRMTYRYALVDYGAAPWAGYSGRFTVAGAGPDRSTVLFEAEMVPVGVTAEQATGLSISNMRAYFGNLDRILRDRC